MRREKVLHYELGNMLDLRNLPSTQLQYPGQGLPFRCARGPVVPRYVGQFEVKPSVTVLALDPSKEDMAKKKITMTETFEEIKVDPDRKDLETERENWQLIMQERFRHQEYVPFQEAEQYLTDVYKQKQLENQRMANRHHPIVIEKGDYKLEHKGVQQEALEIKPKKPEEELEKLVAGFMMD
jgi:hypothetical protein